MNFNYAPLLALFYYTLYAIMFYETGFESLARLYFKGASHVCIIYIYIGIHLKLKKSIEISR